MYRKILVPVVLDHEPNISASLEAARVLLDAGGEIVLLHVIEEVPGHVAAQIPADLLATNRAETELALKGMARTAGDHVRAVVVVGHASRSILDHAADNGIDCIVIASHRPGLQDYFLGSTAARVVRHAACSVLVIR